VVGGGGGGGGGVLLPKLQIIFREILLIMDCISDYSSDVLVPQIGWSPGQLPGCPIH